MVLMICYLILMLLKSLSLLKQRIIFDALIIILRISPYIGNIAYDMTHISEP